MRRRARIVGRGTPARAVLAGGVSRHGAHCTCTYCREPATVTPSEPRRLVWIPITRLGSGLGGGR